MTITGWMKSGRSHDRRATCAAAHENGVAVFRGVPYATGGPARFAPPQPGGRRQGVRDAPRDVRSPAGARGCHAMGDFERPQAEDCLDAHTSGRRLVDTKKRPVLVWTTVARFPAGRSRPLVFWRALRGERRRGGCFDQLSAGRARISVPAGRSSGQSRPARSGRGALLRARQHRGIRRRFRATSRWSGNPPAHRRSRC